MIGAILSAVGGSLGFNGSRQSSNQQSNGRTFVDPSQQPFLQDIRNQAQMLNSQGMPVEGVAGINPALGGALNRAGQLGGMQMGAGAQLMGNASGQTAGTGMALNYASGAMGGNANQGINTALNTGQNMAGMAGMSSAANNSGFNQANLNNYINNDVLNAQITGATRDIFRNLNENQMTGIASQAAGTGNSGSSRAGVMAGIAHRGAQDRASDVAASMRGNAYNTALGIEANRASQNAGFQQQANLANQGAYNTALQSVANLGAGQYNTNMQNQQFGASMARNVGQQGVNNMLIAQQMANTGLGLTQGAGQYMRDYEQQLLNNQYQLAMSPYNSLNFYNNIVGAPNNLSEQSSSGRSSGSSFGIKMGA